jgi:hypothetical protein
MCACFWIGVVMVNASKKSKDGQIRCIASGPIPIVPTRSALVSKFRSQKTVQYSKAHNSIRLEEADIIGRVRPQVWSHFLDVRVQVHAGPVRFHSSNLPGVQHDYHGTAALILDEQVRECHCQHFATHIFISDSCRDKAVYRSSWTVFSWFTGIEYVCVKQSR